MVVQLPAGLAWLPLLALREPHAGHLQKQKHQRQHSPTARSADTLVFSQYFRNWGKSVFSKLLSENTKGSSNAKLESTRGRGDLSVAICAACHCSQETFFPSLGDGALP